MVFGVVVENAGAPVVADIRIKIRGSLDGQDEGIIESELTPQGKALAIIPISN